MEGRWEPGEGGQTGVEGRSLYSRFTVFPVWFLGSAPDSVQCLLAALGDQAVQGLEPGAPASKQASQPGGVIFRTQVPVSHVECLGTHVGYRCLLQPQLSRLGWVLGFFHSQKIGSSCRSSRPREQPSTTSSACPFTTPRAD